MKYYCGQHCESVEHHKVKHDYVYLGTDENDQDIFRCLTCHPRWWKRLLPFLVVMFLFSLPHISFAAVAHTSSGGTYNDPASTNSFTYSSYSSGGGNIDICNIATVNEGTFNTPTDGGSNMTQVGSYVTLYSGNQHLYIYYLLNPSSSAHNIVMSSSAIPNFYDIACDSFSGVDGTTPVDVYYTGSNTSPITISTTTLADNDLGWVASFIGDGIQGAAASGGPGWTAGAYSGNSFAQTYYANAVIHPAGSLSVTLTRTGGSHLVGGMLVGLKPSGAAPAAVIQPPQLLMWGWW